MLCNLMVFVPLNVRSSRHLLSMRMKHLYWPTFAALLLVQVCCTGPAPVQTPLQQLLSHFPARPGRPDTLHCFLADSTGGIAISDTLLKTVLDSTQFESLHFDTGEARFWALGQILFADSLLAGLVQTEEFWFGKQSLLVFDLKQQKCLGMVELSHFYGGDGGQTASESWLFSGKNPPQLFVKTAQHGFIMADNPTGEPQEYLDESGQLLQWNATGFQPVPNPDSLLFLRRFSMNREW
jgi:hypothetical protein